MKEKINIPEGGFLASLGGTIAWVRIQYVLVRFRESLAELNEN